MASRISLGWMMDVDDFAGFESSYISFAQFLQGGLKMGEAYYYEYQEIKVQPSHSNVNSPNPRAIQLPPFIVEAQVGARSGYHHGVLPLYEA